MRKRTQYASRTARVHKGLHAECAIDGNSVGPMWW
jgi:hypothetical protein